MEIPIKRGWSLERDHIFPKHQLEIRGIKQDVNHIGNFRLLSKSRNISKVPICLMKYRILWKGKS